MGILDNFELMKSLVGVLVSVFVLSALVDIVDVVGLVKVPFQLGWCASEGVWPVMEFLLSLVVMVVWRPSERTEMYATSHQIRQEADVSTLRGLQDDDSDDDIELQPQMIGLAQSH